MYWNCNGDDSDITRVNHTLTGSGWFGYHTVTVKPAGASDVRIAKAALRPWSSSKVPIVISSLTTIFWQNKFK